MPISKPSTWETGFKNSPQAETTQLRDMGLYLNTKGEFEAVDTSWANVLNKTPALFYFGEVSSGKGIYLTQKGIGIGIDPTAAGVDFVGTLGAVVDNSLNIYETNNTTTGITALTVGNWNNTFTGGPDHTGTRGELHWDWAANKLSLFAQSYSGGTATAHTIDIDGASLRLNTNMPSANYIQMLDSTGGNVAIGGSSFGSSANLNLAIYNGTAPGSNIGGVSIYADGGAAKVLGGSGTITTFGAADPHCQRCDRDFALEWENEKYGKLAICVWCLSEKFDDIVIEKYEGDN